MAKSKTPSALTVTHYEQLGFKVEKVEQFIPGARIRRDLLGFIDFLAFKDGSVEAIQATSWSNVSARIKKIESDDLADNLAIARKCNWKITVIGWKQDKEGNYVNKVIDLS